MRKIIILALMSISLMACNNDNEKAMQDALNKAGIKISQQDSIIAAQTYRCNYIITYVVDTAYLKTTNGVLDKCIGNRDSIFVNKVGYAVVDTMAHGRWWVNNIGVTSYSNSCGYLKKSFTIKLKNATTHQIDSTILSIYSKTYELVLISKTYGVYSTDYKNMPTKTKNLFRHTYVSSSSVLKDYNNLYNVKQDSIK
jgi:hypothetical protein